MHLTPDLQIILVQMVPFLLLVFVLKAWIFDPFLDYLEERKKRIEGSTSEARQTREQAEEQMAALENKLAKARADIADGRMVILREAEKEQEQIISRAREQSEEQMEQFRQELRKARATASAALEGQLEGISHDAATRVLGRAV